MSPKFGNSSICIKEVIITTRYKLEILHQSVKRIKTKSQNVLEVNSYVCRSYRGKTGTGAFLAAPILNRVKEKILNFKLRSPNSYSDIRNRKGIELNTRLRLGLRLFREHKFKLSFQDTLNPLGNCGQDIKSTTHFFLHFPFFINERHTFLDTIRSLDSKLLDFTDYDLTQTLLFGNTFQTSSNNFKIINASIDYILSSKRFDEPLF